MILWTRVTPQQAGPLEAILEISENKTFDTHAYMHYLHHKYFNVNYGGDGLVPFDRVFGTYHDGSKDYDSKLNS